MQSVPVVSLAHCVASPVLQTREQGGAARDKIRGKVYTTYEIPHPLLSLLPSSFAKQVPEFEPFSRYISLNAILQRLHELLRGSQIFFRKVMNTHIYTMLYSTKPSTSQTCLWAVFDRYAAIAHCVRVSLFSRRTIDQLSDSPPIGATSSFCSWPSRRPGNMAAVYFG